MLKSVSPIPNRYTESSDSERSGLDAPDPYDTAAHADSTHHPVFHLAHCATTCAAPKLWSKLR